MATQTEHLRLHQWEPEDSFLRSDFNEDFAKIDAATGALQQWAGTACVAGSVPIVSCTKPIDVELGFRPKLVILGMYGVEYRFFRICAEGLNFMCYVRGDGVPVSSPGQTSAITDTGFHLDKSYMITSADENETMIRYVAFR